MWVCIYVHFIYLCVYVYRYMFTYVYTFIYILQVYDCV